MKSQNRGLPLVVVSVLFGIALVTPASDAQQKPQPPLDPTAVFRTHVPHLSSAVGQGGAPGPGLAQPTAAASFTGGSAYTGSSVITPTTTIPEAEEHIAVDPGVTSIYVAAISDFSLRGGYNTTKWVLTTDGGSTWRESFVPLDSNNFPTTSDGQSWQANSDPVVAIDRLGNVYLADLYFNASNNANGFYVSVSAVGTLGSSNFLASHTYPVATHLSPSTRLIEDKEWITVDNNLSSPHEGTVYASWTRFICNRMFCTSDFILFSRSTDQGGTWSTPIQISPSSQNGAVQGSQVAVGPDGAVYLVYEVYYTGGQRQQLLAKSTDGGVSFSTPAAITPLFNDLSFKSTYRKNSFASLAVSSNVYVVYADQPNNTVGAEVEFIVSTDSGASFSSPVVINDSSTGQQFMPAATVDDAGVIHASWFDTRNSSASTATYDIYATYSKDSGSTFATNTRVTPTQNNAGKASFIGDYAGIAAAAKVAFPVWTNGGFNSGSLQTEKLTLP